MINHKTIYDLAILADYFAMAAGDEYLSPWLRKSAAKWYGRVSRLSARLERLSIVISYWKRKAATIHGRFRLIAEPQLAH